MSTTPTTTREERHAELLELARRVTTTRAWRMTDVMALAHGVRELLEERSTAVALTEDHWMGLLAELRDELHEVARNSASSHTVASMQAHLTMVDERATRAATGVQRLTRIVTEPSSAPRSRPRLRFRFGR